MTKTRWNPSYQILVALFLAVIAYFQASGITQLLGAALWLPAQTRLAGQPRSAPPLATKTGQAIVERNPFDSETGPLQGKKSATIPSAAADTSDPLSCPSCDSVQVLITAESMSDRSWSVTTVLEKGAARPRQRRVGDDVAGKQVAFIGYNPRQQTPAIWLEGNGGVCQSALFIRRAEPPSRIALASARARRHFALGSAEATLQAYARLSTAERLSVHLSRGRQALDIDVNIN